MALFVCEHDISEKWWNQLFSWQVHRKSIVVVVERMLPLIFGSSIKVINFIAFSKFLVFRVQHKLPIGFTRLIVYILLQFLCHIPCSFDNRSCVYPLKNRIVAKVIHDAIICENLENFSNIVIPCTSALINSPGELLLKETID